MKKQVDKCHYDFARYMTKARWSSLWHQVDEMLRLNPANALEIGPGPGVFKKVCAAFGLDIETLDLDRELEPDHVGSATDLPFSDGSYDVVCAFQMLEHLPYDVSLQAFAEMVRVSRRHVVISLPDARTLYRYRIALPKVGGFDIMVPRPRIKAQEHAFDGEHYWEINKKGYELSRITSDLGRHARLLRSYRVTENPYHRFFVFACRDPDLAVD